MLRKNAVGKSVGIVTDNVEGRGDGGQPAYSPSFLHLKLQSSLSPFVKPACHFAISRFQAEEYTYPAGIIPISS